MSKKNLMGDAAKTLFRGTAGEALAAVTGGELAPQSTHEPQPEVKTKPTPTEEPKQEPKNAPGPVQQGTKPAEPIPAPQRAKQMTVTTMRITTEQHNELRLAALELASEKGGRADASEVLRNLLDDWLVQRQLSRSKVGIR